MSTYRAEKSGIAADIERKLEEKWDDLAAEGVPNAIVDWLNCIQSDPDDICHSAEWEDIHLYLKTGLRLCKVANAILNSEGRTPIKYSRSDAPFFCMDNIGKFLKVAEDYGVKKNDLFQTSDLYEGLKGPTVNVLTCLHALGLTSKAKGFEPQYMGRGAIAQENRRGFSEEEVRAQSSAIIGKQVAGSHGQASQAGMRAPGTMRHIAD